MEKDQNIDNQSQDGKPEEINSEDQNIGFKKNDTENIEEVNPHLKKKATRLPPERCSCWPRCW